MKGDGGDENRHIFIRRSLSCMWLALLQLQKRLLFKQKIPRVQLLSDSMGSKALRSFIKDLLHLYELVCSPLHFILLPSQFHWRDTLCFQMSHKRREVVSYWTFLESWDHNLQKSQYPGRLSILMVFALYVYFWNQMGQTEINGGFALNIFTDWWDDFFKEEKCSLSTRREAWEAKQPIIHCYL